MRFLSLFLFCALFGNAQITRLDSLQKALDATQEDTARITLLNEMGYESWVGGDLVMAKRFHERALKLSNSLGYERGELQSLSRLVPMLREMGDFPQASEQQYKALRLAQKLDDKFQEASAYMNLGNIEIEMANVSRKTKGYEHALELFGKALELARKHKLSRTEANCYGNLAVLYDITGRPDSAEVYYRKTLAYYEKHGPEHDLAGVYLNMGITYWDKNDYPHALDFLQRARGIYKKNNESGGLAITLINIGQIFLEQGQEKEGVSLLLEALDISRAGDDKANQADIYGALSEYYTGRGDAKKGLEYYKQHIALRDSMVNEQNTKQMVRTEMNYEFEKKEAAAKLEQEKKDAVAAAEVKRQRIILVAISCFGLLVLGFAIFAYRSFLQKKRANEEITRQKHLIEEKQKEILDSIHYARRIQTCLLPPERNIARQLERARGHRS